MEFECEHREEIKRTELCQLCGMSGKTLPVYGCKLHGECTIHAGGIRKEGKNNLPLLPVCISCPDRTSAKEEIVTPILPKIPKIVNQEIPKSNPKIGLGKIKKALKDKKFRDSLPESLQPDVAQYLKNPGCGCNTPFYKKLLDTAETHLSEYFKEELDKQSIEKELTKKIVPQIPPISTTDNFECAYRGELQRTETRRVIGTNKDFQVYSCGLLGECTLLPSGIHKENKNELPMLPACISCPFRTSRTLPHTNPQIPIDIPKTTAEAITIGQHYLKLTENTTEETKEFFINKEIDQQIKIFPKQGKILSPKELPPKELSQYIELPKTLDIKPPELPEPPDIFKIKEIDRQIEKKLKESEHLKQLINVEHNQNKQITYLSAQAAANNAYFENCCQCCGCCLWVKYNGGPYDGALFGPISIASSSTSNNINLGLNQQNQIFYTQTLASESVTYTTGSGTFTVPDNFNTLKIEVWGGGGNGAPGKTDGGGGGGGGGYTSTTICAKGIRTQITVDYNVGGIAGTSTVTSASPSISLTATGGKSATGDAGGQGGQGSGGTINFYGFNGQSNDYNDGGNGGHLYVSYTNATYGAGGDGGSGTRGQDGHAPGGGGGGGAAHKAGGAGSTGKVKLTYSQVETIQIQLGFSAFTVTVSYPNCSESANGVRPVTYATNNGYNAVYPNPGFLTGVSIPTSPDGCYSSWTQGQCCGQWTLPFYYVLINAYTQNFTCPQPTGFPDSVVITIGNCKGQAQSNDPQPNKCKDNICCDTWTAYIPNNITLQANGYNFNPQPATEYQIVNFTRGDSDCNGLWDGDTGGWKLLFKQSPTPSNAPPIVAYLINTLDGDYSGPTSGSIEVELIGANYYSSVSCTYVNNFSLVPQSVDSNCPLTIPNTTTKINALIYYNVITQNSSLCPGSTYYTSDGSTTTTLTPAGIQIPLFSACSPQCNFSVFDITGNSGFYGGGVIYYDDELKFITFPTFDPIITGGYYRYLDCATNQYTIPGYAWNYYIYGYYYGSGFSLGVSFAWDFGDGATSNDPNPTHSYSDPGDIFIETSYTVTLIVTSATGVTTTCSKIVNVQPKCCAVCYSFDWAQITDLPNSNPATIGPYTQYAFEQTVQWANYTGAYLSNYGGFIQQVNYTCSGFGGCYLQTQLILELDGVCLLYLGYNGYYGFAPQLRYQCSEFKCDSGGTFTLNTTPGTYCTYYEGENYCGPWQSDPVLAGYVPGSIDLTVTACSPSETAQQCCPILDPCVCGPCHSQETISVTFPQIPWSCFPILCTGCDPLGYNQYQSCFNQYSGYNPCCCGEWQFVNDCPRTFDPNAFIWLQVTGNIDMQKMDYYSTPPVNGCYWAAPTGVFQPTYQSGIQTGQIELWVYLFQAPNAGQQLVGFWLAEFPQLLDPSWNTPTEPIYCLWVLELGIAGGPPQYQQGVFAIGYTTVADYNQGICMPQNLRRQITDYSGCSHGCTACQCCGYPNPQCNFFDPPGCMQPLNLTYLN